jgi:cell wall-associated NlpC family hydrolase
MEATQVYSRDKAQLERRRLALALIGIGLLAGCASRPPVRSASSWPEPSPAPGPAPIAGGLNFDPSERELAVAQAMLLVNTPYTYGGNTPQGGFDCSGLIYYVFQHVTGDRRLPRTTAQWADATVPVSNRQAERGDLVFFNTTGRPFSHMGLFVGDGEFVHAPSTGGMVHKTRLSNPYFARRYQGARRAFAA